MVEQAISKLRALGTEVTLLFFDCFDEVLVPVSYTHLRAHETVLDIVCRLLLEKKHL